MKENKKNQGYRTYVKYSFENKIKKFLKKILMKL